MTSPYTYWSRIISGWRTVGDTGSQIVETAQASREVIAARTDDMREAVTSPLTADYAELTRMVPEKVAAFSMAHTAAVDAWFAIQAEHIAQVQRVGAMMLRGRPPTLNELNILSSQSGEYALRVFEQGARGGRNALAPLKKTAGANARRLAKRRGPTA